MTGNGIGGLVNGRIVRQRPHLGRFAIRRMAGLACRHAAMPPCRCQGPRSVLSRSLPKWATRSAPGPEPVDRQDSGPDAQRVSQRTATGCQLSA